MKISHEPYDYIHRVNQSLVLQEDLLLYSQNKFKYLIIFTKRIEKCLGFWLNMQDIVLKTRQKIKCNQKNHKYSNLFESIFSLVYHFDKFYKTLIVLLITRFNILIF